MNHPDTDFYKEYKVEPPSRDVHWSEEDFRKELKRQKLQGHNWVKQKGPYLICEDNCAFNHAVYIGMDKKFKGLKNGVPELDKVSIKGK